MNSMPQNGRYIGPAPVHTADGLASRTTNAAKPPIRRQRLRKGPDGRIYVAQVSRSQISAIDVATGAIEAISPSFGKVIGPDDLAFDTAGHLYVTEFTEGRVSVRAPNGATRHVPQALDAGQ